MKKICLALLVCLAGAAHAETAAQKPAGARITLAARAAEDVGNDVMRATLFAEMDDADAGRLAARINQAVNDALEAAKAYPQLRARSTGYSTYPVTDKERITGWRSRSEIAIEGEDFRAMGEAIGRLQGTLQLGGVAFSVSPARRAQVEDRLTQAAIADFLRKAAAATRAFRGSRYNVVEAAISADGDMPPPRPVMMRSMAAADAAPAFEAGTSRVAVTVNGVILIPR
ncbi:MAG TPA: SIMPL domain-containing protein [Burkholderiales bacterium]|nr:SIMPL domain-containing protein [Burkholderiales bacterium]